MAKKKYNRVYWIEDRDDSSVEFEHSVTYSKKKALKELRRMNKDNIVNGKKRHYILKWTKKHPDNFKLTSRRY